VLWCNVFYAVPESLHFPNCARILAQNRAALLAPILHIDGRSYRLREIDGLLKQPASDSLGKGGERKTA
jgi:hypothetical protein